MQLLREPADPRKPRNPAQWPIIELAGRSDDRSKPIAPGALTRPKQLGDEAEGARSAPAIALAAAIEWVLSGVFVAE